MQSELKLLRQKQIEQLKQDLKYFNEDEHKKKHLETLIVNLRNYNFKDFDGLISVLNSDKFAKNSMEKSNQI